MILLKFAFSFMYFVLKIFTLIGLIKKNSLTTTLQNVFKNVFWKKKSIKSDLECSKYMYIKQNLVYIPVKESR